MWLLQSPNAKFEALQARLLKKTIPGSMPSLDADANQCVHRVADAAIMQGRRQREL